MKRLLLLCATAGLLSAAGPAFSRDDSRAGFDSGSTRFASQGEIRLDAPVRSARRRHHGPGAQPVFGRSDIPIGWMQFCRERPGDCVGSGPSDAVIELTPQREAQLRAVNLQVNRALKPVADIVHYGVVQRWTIPTDGMGSCHHYMLMKRQALQRLGFPQSALLVTVVRTRTGEGHAVLTVRTSRGDLILDNLTDRIAGWNQTGYRYLMRQSAFSPNSFVSLGGSRSSALATAARPEPRTLSPAWWQTSSRSAVWHPWK